MSDKPESLPQGEGDPTALIGGLASITWWPPGCSGQRSRAETRDRRDVSPQYRDRGLNRDPNESDDMFEARKKFVEGSVEQGLAAVNELDQIALGVGIDRTTEKLLVDFSVKAREGTAMAADLRRRARHPTRLPLSRCRRGATAGYSIRCRPAGRQVRRPDRSRT